MRGPALASTDAGAPRFAFSADASTAAIVRDGLMLTLRLDGEEGERHTVELFDVAADPVGRENLARERLADARQLRAQLVAWLLSAQPARAELVG